MLRDITCPIDVFCILVCNILYYFVIELVQEPSINNFIIVSCLQLYIKLELMFALLDSGAPGIYNEALNLGSEYFGLFRH